MLMVRGLARNPNTTYSPRPPPGGAGAARSGRSGGGGRSRRGRRADRAGLPLIKPPYATITAIR